MLTTDLTVPTLEPALVIAPAAAAAAAPQGGDELSDDDLEHVVGGLTRAWFDGAPADAAAAALRAYAPHVAGGLLM